MEYGHSGNARKAKTVLVVGDDEGDLTIACDDLSGWPDGDSGLKPFWASLGRGGLSEEKVLCESRVGNTLHVLSGGRGGDDTPISTHPIDTVVEHVWTAAEADDSTHHINSTHDVHGIDGDVVGTTDEQTLTNKTLDGAVLNDPIINDGTYTGLAEFEELVSENIHDSVISDSQIIDASQINVTGDQAGEQFLVRNIYIGDDDPASADNGSILIRTDGDNKSLKVRLSSAWQVILAKVFGVPAGGTTGQVLRKASNADGDTEWATPSGGGGGGTGMPEGGVAGDIIVKQSSSDQDAEWVDPTTIGLTLPSLEGNANRVLTVLPDESGVVWAMIPGGIPPVTDNIAQEPYPEGGSIGTFTSGGLNYRYHVFTTPLSTIQVLTVYKGFIGKLLCVAGGGMGDEQHGGGLAGGGGGAGGVIYIDYAFGDGGNGNPGYHSLLVGRGGYTSNRQGEDSRFDDLIARGGGKGGGDSGAANLGGSGGGGSVNTYVTGGAGIVGQGFAGGDGTAGFGGAGGGAGGAANEDTVGPGLTLNLTGTSVEYGRGGAAGIYNATADATIYGPGQGGRGGGHFANAADDGEDGIVIVCYRIA